MRPSLKSMLFLHIKDKDLTIADALNGFANKGAGDIASRGELLFFEKGFRGQFYSF